VPAQESVHGGAITGTRRGQEVRVARLFGHDVRSPG
jgi:hypothetical protein